MNHQIGQDPTSSWSINAGVCKCLDCLWDWNLSQVTMATHWLMQGLTAADGIWSFVLIAQWPWFNVVTCPFRRFSSDWSSKVLAMRDPPTQHHCCRCHRSTKCAATPLESDASGLMSSFRNELPCQVSFQYRLKFEKVVDLYSTLGQHYEPQLVIKIYCFALWCGPVRACLWF